jgi:1-deoxy-D-xylulose-5-phosphate synthase
VFCLDRAGITGDDGPSHNGIFDMALLSKVPGMRLLAPSSAQDLAQMLEDAISLADSGPVAIRYPKGLARSVGEREVGSGLHARKLRNSSVPNVCVLAIGKMVAAAESAVDALASRGIEITLYDVRSCVPADELMIADAARHCVVVTIEDGIRDGGVGMMLADLVTNAQGSVHPRVEVLGLPTKFTPQGKPTAILKQLGLDAESLAVTLADLATVKNC